MTVLEAPAKYESSGRIALAGLMLRTAKVLTIAAVTAAAPASQAAAEIKNSIYYSPIVFMVVRGGPDACGKGCSEWIAAEGYFDPAAIWRLRSFLRGSEERKKMPIFFHSPGGRGNSGLAVGRLLRELRMHVSVGRTTTRECSAVILAADACRGLTSNGREVKARLVAGFCNSACVLALMGGASRKIPDDAYVGIHQARLDGSSGAASIEDLYRESKRHSLELGIDPILIDEGTKVPASKMRRLSRGELARFGIETRGYYETGWRIYPWKGRFEIAKAWRRPTEGGRAPFQVSVLRIGCSDPERFEFILRQERVENDFAPPFAPSIVLGNVPQTMSGAAITPLEETRRESFSASEVLVATSMGAIKIRERVPGKEQPVETSLSTAGLAAMLADLKARCTPATARAQ